MTSSAKLLTGSLVCALLLTGCANPSSPITASADGHSSAHNNEVTQLSRYAVFSDGAQIHTLNLQSGEVVATHNLQTTKLTAAGDNRHLLALDANGLHIYDSGLIAEAHGDHFHYYEEKPQLDSASYRLSTPQSLLVNESFITVTAASGKVLSIPQQALQSDTAAAADKSTTAPHSSTAQADVALLSQLNTDTWLSVTAAGQAGLSSTPAQVTPTAACASPQGFTTTATNDTFYTLGCANGALSSDGTQLQQLELAAGGSTKLVAARGSTVVLGNVVTAAARDTTTPAAQLSQQLALYDLAAKTATTVELESSYLPEALGRGPAGQALVLTTAGELVVIDPDTASLQAKHPLLPAFDPTTAAPPLLRTSGSWGYVADRATQQLLVIDLTNFEVTKRLQLQFDAVDFEIVTGRK